jgi:SWI/SNF-related matrix-associated actin-dependent regulator of chromatin subfamily A member 2/4
MEMTELPPWLTKDPKELEKAILDQETLDVFGRGTRQRKEVDYSDSLTEKEWLRVRVRSLIVESTYRQYRLS